MCERQIDDSRALLDAFLLGESEGEIGGGYTRSLFCASRLLASHGIRLLRTLEERILTEIRTDREAMRSIRHVDWSGMSLTSAQWWLVGWWLRRGNLLERTETLRTCTYALPVRVVREDYSRPLRAFFAPQPPPLDLGGKGVVGRDLVTLFGLCAAPGGLPSLRELDLTYSLVDDDAMAAFGRVLHEGAFAALWALTLANCAITDTGLGSLTAVMRRGRGASLQYVNLSCNLISTVGATEMAAALEVGAGAGICELDLAGNPLGGSGEEALQAACALRDISLRL